MKVKFIKNIKSLEKAFDTKFRKILNLGQRFEPESKQNLVHHEDHWSYDVYDLKSYSDGFCHTFNPLKPQPKGKGYFLSLYLGHHELMKDNWRLKQFNLVFS